MRSCYNPENFKPYYPPTRVKAVPVVFETVRIPASLGDSKTYPPTIGQYKNKIVKYEADETIWLYDSIGNYTEVPTGVSAVMSVNGKTGDVILSTSDLQNDSGYVNGTYVSNAVGVETQDRILADNGLQSQIDALSAASDVTDIVGTYAALQAYDTSKLKDNDIIKVLQDETHNGETTYYRWSKSTSSFTLIGEEGPYYTKSAADQKFQEKLTAGSNISIASDGKTISATDTTYSNFIGTNGSASGTAGLVPAPTTSDVDKYLKSDGTWATVSGGGGGGPTVVQAPGTSTTDVMSQNAVTNYAIGEDETYVIPDVAWYGVSGLSPYDHYTEVIATHTIGNDTIVELINDNAVAFANHAFAIGYTSGQSVIIYSIGAPSSSVTLKINYKG